MTTTDYGLRTLSPLSCLHVARLDSLNQSTGGQTGIRKTKLTQGGAAVTHMIMTHFLERIKAKKL